MGLAASCGSVSGSCTTGNGLLWKGSLTQQHQEEASGQLPEMDLEVRRAVASECEAFGVGEGKTAIFPGVA